MKLFFFSQENLKESLASVLRVCSHLCNKLPTFQILKIESLLKISDKNLFDSTLKPKAAVLNDLKSFLWTSLQNPHLTHETASFPTPQKW